MNYREQILKEIRTGDPALTDVKLASIVDQLATAEIVELIRLVAVAKVQTAPVSADDRFEPPSGEVAADNQRADFSAEQKQLVKNVSLSQTLREKVGARPQQCFHNAYLVVANERDFINATYVEGIAVDKCGFIIGEHGWIVKEGEIIDPTLPDDDLLYFPVLQFEGHAALCRAMWEIPKRSEEDWPIMWRFGWIPGHLPERDRAWQAAREYSNSVIGGQADDSGGDI